LNESPRWLARSRPNRLGTLPTMSSAVFHERTSTIKSKRLTHTKTGDRVGPVHYENSSGSVSDSSCFISGDGGVARSKACAGGGHTAAAQGRDAQPPAAR
jgi:hypothetical protein